MVSLLETDYSSLQHYGHDLAFYGHLALDFLLHYFFLMDNVSVSLLI